MFVGNQLCYSDGERDLDGSSQASKGITCDDGVNMRGCPGDDGSDKSEAVANDEEPATTKNVRQASHNEEANAETEGKGQCHPSDVWGRSYVLIYEPK
jgi:hypothetical protein